MLKYFIIFLTILLIINLILFINIEARIIKKNNEPLLLIIRVFNKTIYKMHLVKKQHSSTFKFKLSYLFESDLNIVLKDLKEENFLVYLILEYGNIKKVTLIPTFNSSNPLIMPHLAFLDWMIVSVVKKYLDASFKYVNDDYYQIMLLKDDKQEINLEIYITVSLFWLVVAIVKKFKVFLKLFKKQGETNE